MLDAGQFAPDRTGSALFHVELAKSIVDGSFELAQGEDGHSEMQRLFAAGEVQAPNLISDNDFSRGRRPENAPEA
jgi:hypothetical protein